MYYAMGYLDADFDKPMIGEAIAQSAITPCNSGLQRLADAAVAEIAHCNANSQVFGTPAASDGIGIGTKGMKYSAYVARGGCRLGRTIALIREGDSITIDAHKLLRQRNLSDQELARRRSQWRQAAPRYTKRVLDRFARLASIASRGAITDEKPF